MIFIKVNLKDRVLVISFYVGLGLCSVTLVADKLFQLHDDNYEGWAVAFQWIMAGSVDFSQMKFIFKDFFQ